MSVVRARFLGPVVASVLVLGAAPALAQETETRVQVNLTESGCEPSAISVPAGPVTFEVVNLGGEVGEFEILQGDFVIDEVENIVPAFQSNLVTRLDGGEYTTVCYTLQSPRGTLSVTGGPAGTRPPSAVVDAATLAAYQAEYETYVRAQGAQFATDVGGVRGRHHGGRPGHRPRAVRTVAPGLGVHRTHRGAVHGPGPGHRLPCGRLRERR